MTSATATIQTRVVPDTYCDSLRLLVATGAMSQTAGISWAGAVMGTAAGQEQLAQAGVTLDVDVRANDLVLAVVADDPDRATAAIEAGARAAFEGREAAAADGGGAAVAPRTTAAAADRLGGAEVAVVSVPGPYAALEAHHALTRGLHVLLFSDNVPVEEERELKERAGDLGLLVMGPGAGTAVVGGLGLGFANAVRRGPVGVVAAAGTGAQEVSALLSRWGVGVSQVIGVGGRDLSAAVGGVMATSAVRALAADPETRAVLLVSKPPDLQVARQVLASCGEMPVVATFLGLDEAALLGLDQHTGAGRTQVARTLEEGAAKAAALVGSDPGTAVRTSVTDELRERVRRAGRSLPASRETVRGYFSGGTLCYEAQLILAEAAGAVYSNEPLHHDRGLPAPPRSHVLLDLGAEEYTQGRPHPMIGPRARVDLIQSQARDPEVAVVLLDVVLGYGAHLDPAGELADACAEVMAEDGPVVVAYVLGTDEDPQHYSEQRARLEAVGCLVPETAASAARAAAAIALRRPELVG